MSFNKIFISIGLLFIPMTVRAEVLGTWPFDGSQAATITISTAVLSGSTSKEPPRASDRRAMRLVIRIDSDDKKWLRGIESVTVQANMPQHEHGMLVTPKPSKKMKDGVFAIDGVQFHMEGEWILLVMTQHAANGIYAKKSNTTTVQVNVTSLKKK
jgi:hypothetical protein